MNKYFPPIMSEVTIYTCLRCESTFIDNEYMVEQCSECGYDQLSEKIGLID